MPMKTEREISPIVVIVTGPPNARAKAAAQLTGRLFRRGFRVRTLHTSREQLSGDGDFLLVPCDEKEVDRWAKQLSERWLTWYATQKRFPRIAGKSTSKRTR